MQEDVPIKVLIADDHDVYRDGLQMLLSKDRCIKILGQAADGRELVRLAGKEQPDIIITDLNMPLMDGVQAIRELSVVYPSLGMIALSVFDDEELVIQALEAGASGYVIKNAQRGEILEAVRTVVQGDPYYCLSTSTQFARKVSQSSFNPYWSRQRVAFTEKEKQVISLMCAERSGREIADTLYMNSRTVERMRAEIFEKMHVKTTAGLVIYAIKNKLYPPVAPPCSFDSVS